MKHLIVPCAVFLGMGMAPGPQDPLKRPDVERARAAANDCQDRSRSERRLAYCLRGPVKNLERALDRFIAEVKVDLPANEKARLDAAAEAWDAEQERAEVKPSRRRRRSTDDPVGQLSQRFVKTLGRFTWVAKKVAAVRSQPTNIALSNAEVQAPVAAPTTPAPAPTPVVAPTNVVTPTPAPTATLPAATAPVATSIGLIAPTPAVKVIATIAPTPVAPATAPALAAAPAPTPAVKAAPAVVPAPVTQAALPPPAPVPAPSAPAVPAAVADPREYLTRVQLMYHGCMGTPFPRLNADISRSVCENWMKKQLTVAFEGYLKDRVAKLTEARQRQLRETQGQWETARQKKCDRGANVEPAVERAAARCWYTETLSRFNWIDKVVSRER